MQAGAWVELNTIGFSGAFLETTSDAQPITEWADSATWDPISKQFFFLGAPHYRPWKFISYSDATNSWRGLPLADSCMSTATGCIGHAYDHNTIDPTTGTVYHRLYNSRTVYQYKISAGSWSTLPQMDVVPQLGIAGGLAYFPERGGLVFVNGGESGGGGVYFFNTAANQWSRLASALPMGPYHNFAEYSPVHKVVIFGGGNNSRDIYRLTASGTITKMRDAPIDLGVRWGSMTTVDPVSGNFLVFGSNRSFYQYNPTTDIWTLQSGPTPPFFSSNPSDPISDTIATPVSTYGVVMVIDYNYSNSKVYLYKHASTPPSDSTPPAAPVNLRVN
jgi:hypothetical protein